jgi:hypothetical protein
METKNSKEIGKSGSKKAIEKKSTDKKSGNETKAVKKNPAKK